MNVIRPFVTGIIRITVVSITCLVLLNSCNKENNPVEPPVKEELADFGIYFLKDTTITIQQVLAGNLSDFQITSTPFISNNDIEFYDWSSHCIYLKKDKSNIFPNAYSASPFPDSWRNRPFIVAVKGRNCYAGQMFMTYASYSLLCPGIWDFEVKYYPTDIIHINSMVGFTTDKRDNEEVKNKLLELKLLHNGLSLNIDSLWIQNNDTALVRYKLTIINNDSDNLYVLDPDKMGTELFHYYTNGPVFYNTLTKQTYNSIFKEVKTPNPYNSYDPSWFTKIESGKALTRTIILKGYQHLPAGQYFCEMTFANPVYIKKQDRWLNDGRYWMGDQKSEIVSFNLF
jgi:hypothetical protein